MWSVYPNNGHFGHFTAHVFQNSVVEYLRTRIIVWKTYALNNLTDAAKNPEKTHERTEFKAVVENI